LPGGFYQVLRDLAADCVARPTFVVCNVPHKHPRSTKHHLANAAHCPASYATRIVREENGKEVCRRLEYGFRPVRLPHRPDAPLSLFVFWGLGEQPMMLTNLPMRGNRKLLWWLVSAYRTR